MKEADILMHLEGSLLVQVYIEFSSPLGVQCFHQGTKSLAVVALLPGYLSEKPLLARNCCTLECKFTNQKIDTINDYHAC